MTSYVKTVWKNLTAPAINETNLNKIEQGIFDATEQVILNKTAVDNIVPSGKTLVYEDSYASTTNGGVIKIRVTGTDCFITTDGSTP